MKIELLSRLKTKIEGWNPREKVLAAVAAGVLLLAATERLVVSPLRDCESGLNEKIAEKSRLLANVHRYAVSRNGAREYYNGPTSQFLEELIAQSKESGIRSITMKKTEYSDKGMNLLFTCEGDAGVLLSYIRKVENMKYLVFFRKAGLKHKEGNVYLFEGELSVLRKKG